MPRSHYHKEEWRRERLSMNAMMRRKVWKLGTQTRKRPGFLPAFSRTIVDAGLLKSRPWYAYRYETRSYDLRLSLKSGR
jgi:hypothetical protein